MYWRLNSDAFFIGFMVSFVIFILLVTSGITVSMPGLFNITNRFNSKDTTKFNDMNTYMKMRSEDKRPLEKSSTWSLVMMVSMITTVVCFILFVIVEFF